MRKPQSCAQSWTPWATVDVPRVSKSPRWRGSGIAARDDSPRWRGQGAGPYSPPGFALRFRLRFRGACWCGAGSTLSIRARIDRENERHAR